MKNNEFDNLMGDDLDWDAFRYVAGEMSDKEAVSFERRLADEQPAREAVARSMQLAHSITVCESENAGSRTPASIGIRHHRWRYVAAFVAASVVGCLIAIPLWKANSSLPLAGVDDKPVEKTELIKNLADEKLMWSWIETRDSWSEFDRFADENVDISTDEVSLDDLEFDSANDTSDGSVSAPNWMLVGLRGLNTARNPEVDSANGLPPQGNTQTEVQLQ